MFTSEPSLDQRIERLIAETPLIDPRSRLSCDRPGVADLAGLLSDPEVRAELRAVGMPAEDDAAALPGDERVRRSLPYLSLMRNTATAWCLYRILRDLYDFNERHLTESNVAALMDQVARSSADPAWAPGVLKDRCNLQAVATSLEHRSADPAKNPDSVRFLIDATPLLCPHSAEHLPSPPRDGGGATRETYFARLATLLGERPATPARLARLVRDWLDRTMTGPVRFTSAEVPIERRVTPPDESQVHFVLTQAAAGRDLSGVEADALARFVTWELLAWHHDNRKAFQWIVGPSTIVSGDPAFVPAHPRYQERWTCEMAQAFGHFGGVRFDVQTSSEALAQEVAALARRHPNVYASGPGGDGFVPASIARVFAYRIQAAPMTKIGAFLSDSASAEWLYGRLQLVKKALASSLSRLVESRFLDEDELPGLLRQVLHDTPRDLYDLAPP
jgi:glucuronate isomerase